VLWIIGVGVGCELASEQAAAMYCIGPERVLDFYSSKMYLTFSLFVVRLYSIVGITCAELLTLLSPNCAWFYCTVCVRTILRI